MSSIIVAGPWIGEFGYELFRWQGHLRYLAQEYEEVIIAGRPGHSVLYNDFATKYCAFNCSVGTNAADGRHCGVDTDLVSLSEQLFAGIPYTHMVCSEQKVIDTDPQMFKRYGTRGVCSGYDVVIHARNIDVDDGVMLDHHKAQKESRNWDYSQWIELMNELPQRATIACIGTVDAAYHIPSTVDLRGIALGKLTDILANSRLVVGPSSGPIHLASLCGCPHVTWGEPHLEQRYAQAWNPLATPMQFIVDEHYNPAAQTVVAAMRNIT